MASRRFRQAAAGGLTLGLCALLAPATGCGKRPTPLPPPEPPAVTVVTPALRDYAPVKEFTGRLATKDPIKVVPQVTGVIKARRFQDGDEVVKDITPLFEIDPVLFQADLHAATADIAKAKADIATATAQKKRDEADLEAVRLQVKKGAGGQVELDKAAAVVEADTARIDLGEANKKAAEAAEAKARQNLAYCVIKAPTTGRVRESRVAPGAAVNAYQTELAEIDPVDPLYVYFDVDELTSLWYREQIARGQIDNPFDPATPLRCRITRKDGSTFPAAGQPGVPIQYVDPEIVRGTGTRTVRAEFPNPIVEDTKEGRVIKIRKLSSGDSVRVSVESGRPRKVVMVPERVVLSSARVKYVFVLTAENEAQAREVTLGPTTEIEEPIPGGKTAIVRYQVIESGLTPTDRVVASNLLRIRPGIQVKVQ